MNSAFGSDTDNLNQILRQDIFAERNWRFLSKIRCDYNTDFILRVSLKVAVEADIWQMKSRRNGELKPFRLILHNIVHNVKYFEKVVHSLSGW